MASLVVERLFELGRWSHVVTMGERHPGIVAGRWRVPCEAAIQVARAYQRLGSREEARALLDRLTPAISDYGGATARRMAVAVREIGEV